MIGSSNNPISGLPGTTIVARSHGSSWGEGAEASPPCWRAACLRLLAVAGGDAAGPQGRHILGGTPWKMQVATSSRGLRGSSFFPCTAPHSDLAAYPRTEGSRPRLSAPQAGLMRALPGHRGGEMAGARDRGHRHGISSCWSGAEPHALRRRHVPAARDDVRDLVGGSSALRATRPPSGATTPRRRRGSRTRVSSPPPA